MCFSVPSPATHRPGLHGGLRFLKNSSQPLGSSDAASLFEGRFSNRRPGVSLLDGRLSNSPARHASRLLCKSDLDSSSMRSGGVCESTPKGRDGASHVRWESSVHLLLTRAVDTRRMCNFRPLNGHSSQTPRSRETVRRVHRWRICVRRIMGRRSPFCGRGGTRSTMRRISRRRFLPSC